MLNIKEMVDTRFNELKQNEMYLTKTDSLLRHKARIDVYTYIRNNICKKTKNLTFKEYSNFIRLEALVLFMDFTLGSTRSIKKGYAHLYDEFQPIFKKMTKEEKKNIGQSCINFAGDINRFNELYEYLHHDCVKSYVRHVASKYKMILPHYENYESFIIMCDNILDIVKKENKNR